MGDQALNWNVRPNSPEGRIPYEGATGIKTNKTKRNETKRNETMPFSALKKAFNMLLDKGCECGDGFKHLFIGYPPVDDSNSNSISK